MRYSKEEIIKWVKANDRWPNQKRPGEEKMYRQMVVYKKADWTFNEEVKWFKGKSKVGNKGKLKGVKHGLSKEWIKLAEFLMDSGGTGAF